jgi:hypothetical protein
VVIRRDALDTASLPGLSITDGTVEPRRVTACLRNDPFRVGGLEIPVSRTIEPRFRRAKSVIVAGHALAFLSSALMFAALATWLFGGFAETFWVWWPLLAAALVVAVAASVARWRLLPRQLPRRLDNGDVLVPYVDDRAAREWAAVNPSGSVVVR